MYHVSAELFPKISNGASWMLVDKESNVVLNAYVKRDEARASKSTSAKLVQYQAGSTELVIAETGEIKQDGPTHRHMEDVPPVAASQRDEAFDNPHHGHTEEEDPSDEEEFSDTESEEFEKDMEKQDAEQEHPKDEMHVAGAETGSLPPEVVVLGDAEHNPTFAEAMQEIADARPDLTEANLEKAVAEIPPGESLNAVPAQPTTPDPVPTNPEAKAGEQTEPPVATEPKPARPKRDIRRKSEIEKPTRMVHAIADMLYAANPAVTRKEILQACEAANIAYNTALTQYQAWRSNRDAKPDAEQQSEEEQSEG